MPIESVNPITIPARSEVIADKEWIDRLAVNASQRLTGSVDAEYDLVAYSTAGVFADTVRTFTLSDVFTLAQSPDRPLLAAALQAIYAAVAEDQAIRAASQGE
jgi:hypothetical protein